MGLVTVNITRLCQLFKRKGIEGKSICMLGRQSILTNLTEIIYLFNKMGIDYDINVLKKMKEKTEIDTYIFFEMLGFKDVHAIDFTKADGADIIFDLNCKDVPDELYERFDYVVDGGTLEHVFNVSQAIANTSKLVKTDGYIIHISPVGGYIEHGFFQFSPTFFNDFYTQNGFEIDLLDIGFYYDKKEYSEWAVMYSMDCRSFSSAIEIDKYIKRMLNVHEIGRMMLWCMARKVNKKEIIYPIQGIYDIKRRKTLYRNIEKEMGKIDLDSLLNHIKECKEKKIALFGAGHICKTVIDELYRKELQNKVAYILDNDINKNGIEFKGYKVLCPTEDNLSYVEEIIICSTRFCDEVYEDLKKEYGNSEKYLRITEYCG